MYHMFLVGFCCLCGFLSVWGSLRALFWDGGAPREFISIGMCWKYGNQLLATAAALNPSLQGTDMAEVWRIRSGLCQSPVPTLIHGWCCSSEQ